MPESERKSQVKSPAGKANTLYSTSLRIFSRSSGFTDSRDLTATVVCEGGLNAVVRKGCLNTVVCEGCLEMLNGVDALISQCGCVVDAGLFEVSTIGLCRTNLDQVYSM